MTSIAQLLGKDADSLLQHRCITTPSDQPYLPGYNYVDHVMMDNNRPLAVLRNVQMLYNTGRLAGTGYLSTLPVNQGVEHSTRASFIVNSLYFGPRSTVELAIEAECNCVVSTYGVLASVSHCYTHRVPFLVKINHNETLSYPNTFDQMPYASVERTLNMGAVTVGVTIYFGFEESRHQIEEISAAFERAHELGMVIVLWAYLHNSVSKEDGVDYYVFTDPTGQTNHLVITIGADIVKQKMTENNDGYKAASLGYTDDRACTKLTSEDPIDLACYQLANCYMGRAGLTNSGGVVGGDTDPSDTVRTAIISRHTDDMGLIPGRKTFKKTMADDVKSINAVQDIYLDSKVTIA